MGWAWVITFALLGVLWPAMWRRYRGFSAVIIVIALMTCLWFAPVGILIGMILAPDARAEEA